MNRSRQIELMHAVLDGEATAEEGRELDAVLASDARAREEYEELRGLFEGLRALPQPFPPEGLAASVLDSATSLVSRSSRPRRAACSFPRKPAFVPATSSPFRARPWT